MLEPLDDQVDHVRGALAHPPAPMILEYGDYECPYSRRAFRAIEQVERELPGGIRFAFRHFPLTEIHPHALAAAGAAEAAARQDRFWEMHSLLFHRQQGLEDDDLHAYANELDLDVSRFDQDRASDEVAARIARDVASAQDTGVVLGTPTLFINGALHDGSYETETLLEALGR